MGWEQGSGAGSAREPGADLLARARAARDATDGAIRRVAEAEGRRRRRRRRIGLGILGASLLSIVVVSVTYDSDEVFRAAVAAHPDDDLDPQAERRLDALIETSDGGRPVIDRSDYPTPADDPSPRPLGRPPRVPDDGDHSFRLTQERAGSGTPVAYDPCRPIRVVVNDRRAPLRAGALLEQALEVVEEATGLHFTVEGRTDERSPAERADERHPEERDPVQARYGDRWAPVLVDWTDMASVPRLEGEIVGLGGSTARFANDRLELVYVTGLVVLEGDAMGEIMDSEDGWAMARAIVVHELGHLVGLDHVGSPVEVMHANGVSVTALGAGDRAGLAALGRGRCYPGM